MSDDLRDVYDLPRDFNLDHATHMDRVEAADGTQLRVVESALSGTRQLVHEDIIEYDGVLGHPMTAGFLGFLAIFVGFVGPVFAGYTAATTAGSTLAAIGAVLMGVIVGYGTATVLLYRTPFGGWLWRFLEWNDHKHLIMARGDQA